MPWKPFVPWWITVCIEGLASCPTPTSRWCLSKCRFSLVVFFDFDGWFVDNAGDTTPTTFGCGRSCMRPFSSPTYYAWNPRRTITSFHCVHDATPCQATTRSSNSYHEWWSGRKHAVYLDQTILLGDRPLSLWKTTPSPMSPVPTIRMTLEQLLMEAIRNHNGARHTTGTQP